MSVTNSSRPISIAEARVAGAAGKIVLARLRDLALLPALALLVVIGAIVSRALVGGMPEREAKRTLERLRAYLESRSSDRTSVR